MDEMITKFRNKGLQLWIPYLNKKHKHNYNYEELEDLFQDIFLEVWNTRNKSSIKGFEKNFRIRMKFRFIDYYNKKKNEYIGLKEFERNSSVINTSFGYPCYKDIRDGFQKILNEEQWYILKLWLDGYTQDEISKLLDISIATLERKVSLIKDTIKKNETLFLNF